MTDAEQIEYANRAQRAMDEFLAPAFDVVEAEFAERMIHAAASEDPNAVGRITRLAISIRAAREARKQIEAIIAAGKVAQANRDRDSKMAAMTPTQRRLLNIGSY